MDGGFSRVRPLTGGLEAWIEAGGETDTHPGLSGARND
jgi:3-mercaptopyruvate sulfurtransferase SseA